MLARLASRAARAAVLSLSRPAVARTAFVSASRSFATSTVAAKKLSASLKKEFEQVCATFHHTDKSVFLTAFSSTVHFYRI